jgi:DNA-binding NarL/FixJ family response regulator
MKEPIRIAIAEDHALVRQGIISLLQEEEELQVQFDVENGAVLIEKLKEFPCDVILLDIDMPVMGGKEALEIIQKNFPEVRVIMISMHYDDSHITEYISNGARGFLAKNSDIELVIRAIIAVHQQGYYFDDKVSRTLLNRLIQGEKIKPSFTPEILSERETEILILTCGEKTNIEIAEKLCISRRTVEGHRQRIAEKTNSKNTAGLVIYAIKNGVISI